MKTLVHRLLCIFTAVALVSANAGVSDSNPDQIMVLVDEYIRVMNLPDSAYAAGPEADTEDVLEDLMITQPYAGAVFYPPSARAGQSAPIPLSSAGPEPVEVPDAPAEPGPAIDHSFDDAEMVNLSDWARQHPNPVVASEPLILGAPNMAGLSSLPVRPEEDEGEELTPSEVQDIEKRLAGGEADKTDSPLVKTAKRDHVNKEIMPQIARLDLADFSALMANTAARYYQKPNERPILFRFFQDVHNYFGQELANIEQLKNGPGDSMIQAGYKVGFLIIMGLPFANAGLSSWLKRPALSATRMAVRYEARRQAPRLVRWTRGTAEMAAAWGVGFGLGAGVGGIKYLYDMSQVHRLDPLSNLRVVQTGLACDISVLASNLKDRFDSLSDDEFKKAASEMAAQAQDLKDQAEELRKQNPLLAHWTVDETHFRKDLKDYPTIELWRKLKKSISEGAQPQDGQCRELNLDLVALAMSKMIADLKEDTQ